MKFINRVCVLKSTKDLYNNYTSNREYTKYVYINIQEILLMQQDDSDILASDSDTYGEIIVQDVQIDKSMEFADREYFNEDNVFDINEYLKNISLIYSKNDNITLIVSTSNLLSQYKDIMLKYDSNYKLLYDKFNYTINGETIERLFGSFTSIELYLDPKTQVYLPNKTIQYDDTSLLIRNTNIFATNTVFDCKNIIFENCVFNIDVTTYDGSLGFLSIITAKEFIMNHCSILSPVLFSITAKNNSIKEWYNTHCDISTLRIDFSSDEVFNSLFTIRNFFRATVFDFSCKETNSINASMFNFVSCESVKIQSIDISYKMNKTYAILNECKNILVDSIEVVKNKEIESIDQDVVDIIKILSNKIDSVVISNCNIYNKRLASIINATINTLYLYNISNNDTDFYITSRFLNIQASKISILNLNNVLFKDSKNIFKNFNINTYYINNCILSFDEITINDVNKIYLRDSSIECNNFNMILNKNGSFTMHNTLIKSNKMIIEKNSEENDDSQIRIDDNSFIESTDVLLRAYKININMCKFKSDKINLIAYFSNSNNFYVDSACKDIIFNINDITNFNYNIINSLKNNISITYENCNGDGACVFHNIDDEAQSNFTINFILKNSKIKLSLIAELIINKIHTILTSENSYGSFILKESDDISTNLIVIKPDPRSKDFVKMKNYQNFNDELKNSCVWYN